MFMFYMRPKTLDSCCFLAIQKNAPLRAQGGKNFFRGGETRGLDTLKMVGGIFGELVWGAPMEGLGGKKVFSFFFFGRLRRFFYKN